VLVSLEGNVELLTCYDRVFIRKLLQAALVVFQVDIGQLQELLLEECYASGVRVVVNHCLRFSNFK